VLRLMIFACARGRAPAAKRAYREKVRRGSVRSRRRAVRRGSVCSVVERRVDVSIMRPLAGAANFLIRRRVDNVRVVKGQRYEEEGRCHCKRAQYDSIRAARQRRRAKKKCPPHRPRSLL